MRDWRPKRPRAISLILCSLILYSFNARGVYVLLKKMDSYVNRLIAKPYPSEFVSVAAIKMTDVIQ